MEIKRRGSHLSNTLLRPATAGQEGLADWFTGMARIDPETSAVTTFQHKADDETTLSGNAVESIAFAPDGTLWVGTSSGLNAFDPGSDAYWRQLFGWLCHAGPTATKPSTWGGVKAVYR